MSCTVPSASGNGEEQQQILVDSLISHAAPAGAKSDTPAAVPVTAQHAEQAVKPKRKPGRPRKIPLKPGAVAPASTTGHTLPSPAAGSGVTQATYGPHLPYGLRPPDVQLGLSPAASGPQSNAADAVPAGALMPHRRSSSVSIDMSKLLKSRNKAQPPSSKASGNGSTLPAHQVVSGAIIPDGKSAIPTSGQPNYSMVQSPAAAADSAVTAAAAPVALATEAEPKTASQDGREAAPLATEAAPMTSSQGAKQAADVSAAVAASVLPVAVAAATGAPKTVPQGGREAAAAVTTGGASMTGSGGGREAAAGTSVMPAGATGSPAKQTAVTAAIRQQSAASSATLSAPASPTSPTAATGKSE